MKKRRSFIATRAKLLILQAAFSKDPNIRYYFAYAAHATADSSITVAAQHVAARLDSGTFAPAQIDATVTQLMEAAHVTGAGIAIFHESKIAYLNAYGLRDTEKRLPLTPNSVMTSASLSKAAFATLVMRLVQEGVVDLNKPVYEYLPKPLPKYPRYADLQGDDRYKKLTLRILLSHTSGFPNWRAFENDRKLKIHYEPATRYAYSGEGLDLAQLQGAQEGFTHGSANEQACGALRTLTADNSHRDC
jgi:CubicO group peptidase (beta-lactamase class C family)